MSYLSSARSVAAIGLVAMTAVVLQSQAPDPSGQKITTAVVDSTIQSWKAGPQKAARMILDKYGLPQEASANRLIWQNNGPWKTTVLVNEEVPHDFPMPHKDMLYQSVNYRIDSGDADELLAYDGSIVLERTKGELAARCDNEEANFLAINLANDIATGKRSVDDARKFYAETVTALMKGQPNEYVKGFRFQVIKTDAGDRDKPFGPMGTSGR
jgi:hypothetical protein